MLQESNLKDTVKPQSDLTKKVFGDLPNVKKEKISTAMNIEAPKPSIGLSSQFIDNIDDKTNSYVTKVEK